MANGWQALGTALGGDSEDAYEKGLALGANTQNALAQARARVDENTAKQGLADALSQIPGIDPKTAAAASTTLRAGGNLGDAINLALKQQEYNFHATAGDPNVDFEHRNIAAQGLTNAPTVRFHEAGPGQIQDVFSNDQPTVTPIGESLIDSRAAKANLDAERAAHPERFRGSATNTGDPEMDAALSKAVAEGRLDPSRLNSRTAVIYGKLALSNPALNFNEMIADANLQKNPNFRQRAMTMEALPEVMTSMVEAGKKVGFNDIRTVGKMQAWLNGETNDPDMQEYMTLRNDALMSIANVMRGVGMSDQAHRAEIEAGAPTMSPQALDAWFRGQMKSLEPRLRRVHGVTHLGEQPAAAPSQPVAAPVPAAAAPAAISLSDYLKSKGH